MVTAKQRADKQENSEGLVLFNEIKRKHIIQLGFSNATFLAVEACGPQGALAGISSRERDAGGAVGTQRRGTVLDITHRHGLRAEGSLPS